MLCLQNLVYRIYERGGEGRSNVDSNRVGGRVRGLR
jgi:hypothetical protein